MIVMRLFFMEVVLMRFGEELRLGYLQPDRYGVNGIFGKSFPSCFPARFLNSRPRLGAPECVAKTFHPGAIPASARAAGSVFRPLMVGAGPVMRARFADLNSKPGTAKAGPWPLPRDQTTFRFFPSIAGREGSRLCVPRSRPEKRTTGLRLGTGWSGGKKCPHVEPSHRHGDGGLVLWVAARPLGIG